jgi:hypothetical protein
MEGRNESAISFSKNLSFWAISVFMFLTVQAIAQPDRWQQKIAYKMNVNLDVNTNLVNGSQEIKYTNKSPDTLHRIFFHTYWNAFQPGSSMDVRSQELGKTQVGTNRDGTPRWDWDARVQDRIGNLKPEEIGLTRLQSVTIGGLNAGN